MQEISKLKDLFLTTEVVKLLETYLNIKEKVLAEFIIDIGTQSKNLEEFVKKLDEKEANFSEEFMDKLYETIKKKGNTNNIRKINLIPTNKDENIKASENFIFKALC